MKRSTLTIQIIKPVIVWSLVGDTRLEATLHPGQLVECDKVTYGDDCHVLHMVKPMQPNRHTEDTPAVYVWRIEPDAFRLAPSKLLKTNSH